MIEIYEEIKIIKKYYGICTCVKKAIKSPRIDQDWLGHIPTVPCGFAAPAFINFNQILLRSSLKNNFKHQKWKTRNELLLIVHFIFLQRSLGQVVVPDKPQEVEKFHFTQYGYMGLGTRCYVKLMLTFRGKNAISIFYFFCQSSQPSIVQQLQLLTHQNQHQFKAEQPPQTNATCIS